MLQTIICNVQREVYSEISGSHGGEYEDGCLLGCCVVWSGGSSPTFQRCLLPSENFYQTTRRNSLKVSRQLLIHIGSWENPQQIYNISHHYRTWRSIVCAGKMSDTTTKCDSALSSVNIFTRSLSYDAAASRFICKHAESHICTSVSAQKQNGQKKLGYPSYVAICFSSYPGQVAILPNDEVKEVGNANKISEELSAPRRHTYDFFT
jgi:hypothetical protein